MKQQNFLVMKGRSLGICDNTGWNGEYVICNDVSTKCSRYRT